MAAKKTRKPAIERPQGIVDDIIVPIAKRVLKGGTKKKAMTKIAASQYKKSAKAGVKIDKAAVRELEKLKHRFRSEEAMVTSRGIRRQYKKHYQGAEVGNAITQGKSTKGVARKAKSASPKYVIAKEYGYGRGKR